MSLGLSTCEEHDCVVVYSGNRCPFCELVVECDEATKDLEAMTNKRDSAKAYADELADELAQYNQPVKPGTARKAL